MNDKEAIAILRRYVDQPSPQRVQNSVTALRSKDLLASPDLIAALADPDPDLRLLVIEILSELDPIDSSLPAPVNALEDPDRIVRIAAVDPVTRFGSRAQAAVPILEKWLKDEKEYVRIAAATAIGKIDPAKIPVVLPVLLEGLRSEHSIDRANAAYAIGDLGEAGSEALPLLEELLTDGCAAPRCEAASAISKITGDPTAELSVAVDLLGAVEWLDRYVGAEHLMCMGTVAAPALPDLRRALDDEDAAVRAAVKVVIQRIEGA